MIDPNFKVSLFALPLLVACAPRGASGTQTIATGTSYEVNRWFATARVTTAAVCDPKIVAEPQDSLWLASAKTEQCEPARDVRDG